MYAFVESWAHNIHPLKGKNDSQEPKVKIYQNIKIQNKTITRPLPLFQTSQKCLLAMMDKRKLVGVSQTNLPNAFN